MQELTKQGALLLAVITVMWGMLKFLVVDKLKSIQEALRRLENGHETHTTDIHELDLRLTKLETQHADRACPRGAA